MGYKYRVVEIGEYVLIIQREKNICFKMKKKEFEEEGDIKIREIIDGISKMRKKYDVTFPENKKQMNTIYLFVTDYCNLNCEFCAMRSNNKDIKKEKLSQLEVKEHVIDKIRKANPSNNLLRLGEKVKEPNQYIDEICEGFFDAYTFCLDNKKLILNYVSIFENIEVKKDGVIDIWNALTSSEKKLVIRYPFDALKVNKAKEIATKQTERKFGKNGLGDRSDAFRHGIWNAEMTVLIGSEKAELFATAHEDKDTTGNESDGYTKDEHKKMDLHNNEIGRKLGADNLSAPEEKMAEIIYDEIMREDSLFVWLHE